MNTPNYFKVKLSKANGSKIFWAELLRKRGDAYILEKINSEGEGGVYTRKIIIADVLDIAWMKPAKISRKYGILQVIKD